MKHYLIGGVVVILFAILVSLLRVSVSNSINSEKAKYEQHLGKDIIIKSDTLVIIDYNILKDIYTLDDGRECSYKFIDNRLNNEN